MRSSLVDGKEICPIKDSQLQQCCEEIERRGIRDVVIVGVFSPLATSGSQEEYAKKFILGSLGLKFVNVVCSKDGTSYV
jgi:N-methylhydantoinase A/oxoprolinase/acetone carboxylase beta subunit